MNASTPIIDHDCITNQDEYCSICMAEEDRNLQKRLTLLREALRKVKGRASGIDIEFEDDLEDELNVIAQLAEDALTDEAKTDPATCHDCGRHYGSTHGFPDLIVPDDVWEKISPTGHEGGLLCPSCLCQRAYEKGIECTAVFKSGPFYAEGTT